MDTSLSTIPSSQPVNILPYIAAGATWRRTWYPCLGRTLPSSSTDAMAADLTVDDVTDAEIAMNEAAAALAATLPAADIEPPPPHKAAANFAAKRRPHETRQALVRTPSRRDLVTTSRKAQVFAVTATMAMVEVQSRNVLGMLLASSIKRACARLDPP